jgi:hypothetical protein
MKPHLTNQRLAIACLMLSVCSIIVACTTTADGKRQIDSKKVETIATAAADAAIAAYLGGASSKEVKGAAIAAGSAILKTEPDPVELPVTESK